MARSGGTTRTRRRTTAAARRRRTRADNPISYTGRALAGLWMGLAHAVGWVVRAVGRQAATARDLDPEHRRDGGGLLVLGLAILLAVAVWFSSAGPVGEWLATAARLFFGAIATALPLLLLVGAVRLMRAPPEEDQHRGRAIVGWTALIVGTAACCTWRRTPTDPGQIDHAGGLIGCGVGARAGTRR